MNRGPRLGAAVVLALAALIAAGCAGLFSYAERARALAQANGFVEVDSGDARLRAWLRDPAARGEAAGARILTVYIEGDGARWPLRDAPPRDPTPENPLGLRLAIAAAASPVGYVGRPCQYLDAAALARCDPGLWTLGRYGEPAVTLVGRAVDALKRGAGAARVRLVGHSGGGAIAALLAARRDDVACLVTAASPLDIAEWARAAGVTPLAGSLNPLDDAARLGGLPQFHLVGARDEVVPPGTVRAYLARNASARLVEIPGFDHECCWARDWPDIAARTCLAGR